MIAVEVGHPVAVRSVPRFLLRALGLINAAIRGLPEMAYEFEEPFVLNTSRYEATFGAAGTPPVGAIGPTVRWYRSRSGSSSQGSSPPAPGPETPDLQHSS